MNTEEVRPPLSSNTRVGFSWELGRFAQNTAGAIEMN